MPYLQCIQGKGTMFCWYPSTFQRQIYRHELPQRRISRKELAEKKTYNAHSAVADVKILQELTKMSKPSHTDIVNHSSGIESCFAFCKHAKESRKMLATMTGMLNEKVVSKLILNKMAESGLDLSKFILAYKRDNVKKIQSVLSEKMR